MTIERNATRAVRVGSVTLGDHHPIVIQSMTATRTQDIKTTAEQAEALRQAGAGIVRLAIDSRQDVEALRAVRERTTANLCVDLQENYRLAADVAPLVSKIRYNPGHLHHHERQKSWTDKVKFLAEVAANNDCAMRIGVNCGSLDPLLREKYHSRIEALVASALEHAECLERQGFTRFCVSLKDSDPAKVVAANRRFGQERPDIPLHLGVTEAGLPPDGIIKSRIALEQLIGRGLGDTVRISLTLPNPRKHEEVSAARQILDDIAAGRVRSVVTLNRNGLNIISCPSCSRVENERFVELAENVRELTRYASQRALTIAVMGCRVNGPGETDDADLGLWCGPQHVNLKRRGELVGQFSYDVILERLKTELDGLIEETHRECAGTGAS